MGSRERQRRRSVRRSRVRSAAGWHRDRRRRTSGRARESSLSSQKASRARFRKRAMPRGSMLRHGAPRSAPERPTPRMRRSRSRDPRGRSWGPTAPPHRTPRDQNRSGSTESGPREAARTLWPTASKSNPFGPRRDLSRAFDGGERARAKKKTCRRHRRPGSGASWCPRAAPRPAENVVADLVASFTGRERVRVAGHGARGPALLPERGHHRAGRVERRTRAARAR